MEFQFLSTGRLQWCHPTFQIEMGATYGRRQVKCREKLTKDGSLGRVHNREVLIR